MADPDPIARLKTLAVRQNLSLGVMASARPADFDLVLAAAGCAFDGATRMSEPEVNDRLVAWLRGTGAMLAADHVELRRWLVDNGVLARDGYGRVYTRATPRPAIADAMAALAGQDLASIVRNARAAERLRRESRKAQWVKT
jgi:hypothetical protein